jgi:hypothetical protein
LGALVQFVQKNFELIKFLQINFISINFKMNSIQRFLVALGLCVAAISPASAQDNFAQSAAKEPGAKVTPTGLVFLSVQDGQGSILWPQTKSKCITGAHFPMAKNLTVLTSAINRLISL